MIGRYPWPHLIRLPQARQGWHSARRGSEINEDSVSLAGNYRFL
jgi:hypothetical protein